MWWDGGIKGSAKLEIGNYPFSLHILPPLSSCPDRT